jgi:hypothetical protein
MDRSPLAVGAHPEASLPKASVWRLGQVPQDPFELQTIAALVGHRTIVHLFSILFLGLRNRSSNHEATGTQQKPLCKSDSEASKRQ